MGGVLVTGGAGFIGSHVCEALLGRGERVIALDNFCETFDRRRKEANAARLSGRPGFALVRGDVRERECLREVLGRHSPRAVVHLAAIAGVRDSLRSPELYADVNVGGVASLVGECGEATVESVVFASSSSIYGDRGDPPFRESDSTDHPASPYAATKKAGELLLHAFYRHTSVPVTCLRYFTVYGPRQRPGMAIEGFARAMLGGREVTVFGDGSSARDYTFIDDVVDGTLRAIDRPEGFRILNVGSGLPVRLSELVTLIAGTVGCEPIVKHASNQAGDVRLTFAATEAAEAALGFRARTPVAEGIRRTVDWVRSEVR